jgi:hypothetical protein
MKKISAILLTLALVLTSCGPDAVKFNDTLVDCTDKAHKQIETLTDNLNNALDSEDYTSIAPSAKSTIDSLNIYIETANKLEVPKGGEDFKASVVAYLQSLVAGCESYSAYSTITEETTDEQFNAINSAVEQTEEAQDKLFNDLTAKQKAFAKANNMDLR